MPLSPGWRGLVDDEKVAVVDAGVDHRVTLDAEEERGLGRGADDLVERRDTLGVILVGSIGPAETREAYMTWRRAS
ncbi:MAG: hypothetical protein CMM84_15030 [Rhodothermaceae bacterium]|nr:hypothetical protein [Rhodothermaceae bacterium]MBC12997.1 hypothetical protein [Rhodothermaceae bacterium]